MGRTIGSAGIDQALAQLAALKKDPGYGIGAADYYYLASELDRKHGLKRESIKIFDEGIKDYPDDFRLNYSFAETLRGGDDRRAAGLYRKCVGLYERDDKNARYAEEYRKALAAAKADAEDKAPKS